MKYNKQIILDYISGKEIDEELLKSLENNEEFMTYVIKLTRDIKMYNYCSEELKDSYTFVNFLIDLFKDDPVFVIGIVEEYMGKHPYDQTKRIELVLKLVNLHKITKKEEYLSYGIERSLIFTEKIEEIEEFLEDEEEIKEECGLGFVFVELDYEESKEIMNFFAIAFIEEYLFTSLEIMEKIVHKNFSTILELDNFGEYNFIIRYVEAFDYYLAGYLERNTYILDRYKKDFARIKINWDNYVERTNKENVEKVYDEMCSYEDEHGPFDFDTQKDLIAIIKRLGLEEVFEKYPIQATYGFDFETTDEIVASQKSMAFEVRDYTLSEVKFIHHMIEYIRNLFDDEYDEEDIIEKEKEKPKSKIISYDFHNKKILSIEDK